MRIENLDKRFVRGRPGGRLASGVPLVAGAFRDCAGDLMLYGAGAARPARFEHGDGFVEVALSLSGAKGHGRRAVGRNDGVALNPRVGQ